MAEIKGSKGSPMLDMTPMVDLAFLLVTFFMLTATSRVKEPVIVDTPSSVSEKILPENVMMITIDTAGRTFYTISNAEVRKKTLEKMGQKYKIAFTENEIERFSGMESFGVPMAQLKEYINMDAQKRDKVVSPGIPHDSLNNELSDWIFFGDNESKRKSQEQKDAAELKGEEFDKNQLLRYAIKADGKTAYQKVDDVIKIFKEKKMFRFCLITNLEERKAE